MAPTPLQQRRTHNTLLFQKLLNLRDGASPFTLVLDTLEQSGTPVVKEFARRATISKTKIIYISFTTLRRKISFDVDVFVAARAKSLSKLRAEIISHLPAPSFGSSTHANITKYLLIIDTLHPLASTSSQHISAFLSSLLISPQISLLATYHTDVPLTSPNYIHTSHVPTQLKQSSNKVELNAYQPQPLQTLLYLSTAILTLSSLSHVLSAKRARDKSLHPPVFGLAEQREGVLFGLRGLQPTLGSGSEGEEVGVVVNMELRRKSGRGVVEDFVLVPSTSSTSITKSTIPTSTSTLSKILLLDEHPAYAPPVITSNSNATRGHGADVEDGEVESTFSMGLTEKQRRDREGVVLPYFDAQGEGGVGDGGRILYEMGEEDREDFDDEEDEI